MSPADAVPDQDQEQNQIPAGEEDFDPTPRPGEFYYEGPYLVFTEAYHLRRGHCCQSGCRHCPYGFEKSIQSPDI